jgi:hypothetical protein
MEWQRIDHHLYSGGTMINVAQSFVVLLTHLVAVVRSIVMISIFDMEAINHPVVHSNPLVIHG